MTEVYTKMPHIGSQTVECHPVDTANWLNDMADRTNAHDLMIIDLTKLVKKLANEVACLDEELKNTNKRVKQLEQCCDEAKGRIQHLEENLGGNNNIFNMMDERIRWFEEKLPTGKGNIPDSWKFGMGDHYDIDETYDHVKWFRDRVPGGMDNIPSGFNLALGNINVMSNGPSLNLGIFTSRAIEDNDLHFN